MPLKCFPNEFASREREMGFQLEFKLVYISLTLSPSPRLILTLGDCIAVRAWIKIFELGFSPEVLTWAPR